MANRLRKAHGTMLKAGVLALLAGAAGCSDDFARMNGGLTTASLGLERPSNQDMIIRKGGSAAIDDRTGVRPSDVPQQAYPAVDDTEPSVTYVAPEVTADALPPLTPSEPATDAPIETASVAEVAAPVVKKIVPKPEPVAKTVVRRTVTKPKLAAEGIPVVPPAPTTPGRLRKIGDDITTGSVKPVSTAKIAAPGGGYTVVSGDTIYAIARRYGVTSDQLMQANGMDASALRIGQRLAIPGRGGVASVSKTEPKAEPTVAYTASTKKTVTASVSPAPSEEAAAPKVEPKKGAVSSTAEFSWPARGRVVGSYGQRTAKGTNDGVDIALPEGTAIKAAADGIVLYSGSELKDFGNLVLVRHDNGWVSAYANASKNLVKRGEQVTRGQTISRSGKSGNASQPQLHFELRKNSKPVDPERHLKG